MSISSRIACAAILISMLIITFTEAIALDSNSYPRLKSGDWEMSVKMAQMPIEMKSIYCVDEATQNKMIAQAQEDAMCDEPKVSKQGSTYLAEVTCKNRGTEMHSKSETTFIGETELRMKATITVAGQSPSNVTSNAKYLGPCGGGRKPGDMTLIGPDGKPINVGNMEQLQKIDQKFNQQKTK